MKAAAILLPCLLIMSPVAVAADKVPKEVSALLDKKTFTEAGGGTLPYRLLRPEPYEDGKSYPLVVFLHGAGERGDDNEAQLVHGVAEFTRPEVRKKYPCFLVAPQCPRGKKWSDIDWASDTPKLPAEPSAEGALVLELIAALQKECRIDAQRIYLTGLSMGGYGTWDLLIRRPDLFAAAVPICGGGDETHVDNIVRIPIWVFHGAQDRAVKVERSRRMVAALENAGGHPLYTEYPDEGHASWVPAYRAPAMMRWLFKQVKPLPSADTPAKP
jgi:predicted peptidase